MEPIGGERRARSIWAHFQVNIAAGRVRRIRIVDDRPRPPPAPVRSRNHVVHAGPVNFYDAQVWPLPTKTIAGGRITHQQVYVAIALVLRTGAVTDVPHAKQAAFEIPQHGSAVYVRPLPRHLCDQQRPTGLAFERMPGPGDSFLVIKEVIVKKQLFFRADPDGVLRHQRAVRRQGNWPSESEQIEATSRIMASRWIFSYPRKPANRVPYSTCQSAVGWAFRPDRRGVPSRWRRPRWPRQHHDGPNRRKRFPG